MTEQPTPTLRELTDQCDREIAAIEARLAADLGPMTKAEELELPWPDFQARQLRRVLAVREKQDVILATSRAGGVILPRLGALPPAAPAGEEG